MNNVLVLASLSSHWPLFISVFPLTICIDARIKSFCLWTVPLPKAHANYFEVIKGGEMEGKTEGNAFVGVFVEG